MAEKKPTTKPDEVKDAPERRSNGAVFLIAALDMSWRLAIAVLVPIIGGFEIDKHAGTSPALTIIGFVVAMAGMAGILKWTIRNADKRFNTGGPSS